MSRILQIAHTVLFLSGAGLCAFGAFFLWTAQQQLRVEAVQVENLTRQTADLERQFTATLQQINRPCGSGHPCGTLSDIGKTLGTLRGAAGQIEVAARHETKRIGVLDAQETRIASDTHKVLTDASATLESAKAAIDNLIPAEAELEVELRETQRATAAITTLAMDPNLRAMAKNLNSAAGHADTALSNVADTTGDVKQAVHGYLHPKWTTKVWHGVTGAGVRVAKFLW